MAKGIQYRDLMRAAKKNNLKPTTGWFFAEGRACAVGLFAVSRLGVERTLSECTNKGNFREITAHKTGVDVQKLWALDSGFSGHSDGFSPQLKKYYQIGQRVRKNFKG